MSASEFGLRGMRNKVESTSRTSCKVKEMDDEEYGYNVIQEPLFRVEKGDYEYR